MKAFRSTKRPSNRRAWLRPVLGLLATLAFGPHPAQTALTEA